MEMRAVLADPLAADGPSLSPRSLLNLGPSDRVVLPSPNGSTCAVLEGQTGAVVYAACLRNATAVGKWVTKHHESATVIACGERWPDGSLRPSLEDHLGAAAVLSTLRGTRSPEAEGAIHLWEGFRSNVQETIANCVSGREAIARGWSKDLEFACQVDTSQAVPSLTDGGFVNVAGGTWLSPITPFPCSSRSATTYIESTS